MTWDISKELAQMAPQTNSMVCVVRHFFFPIQFLSDAQKCKKTERSDPVIYDFSLRGFHTGGLVRIRGQFAWKYCYCESCHEDQEAHHDYRTHDYLELGGGLELCNDSHDCVLGFALVQEVSCGCVLSDGDDITFHKHVYHEWQTERFWDTETVLCCT